MPIYEFQCPDCHYLYEEWFKIKEAPKKLPCKKCNGTMKRIVSSTSFILKGTGWYKTDYQNKSTHSKKEPKKEG